MASEILAVPEEHLQVVIDIIREGKWRLRKRIASDVEYNLEKWCREEEKYLKRLHEDNP